MANPADEIEAVLRMASETRVGAAAGDLGPTEIVCRKWGRGGDRPTVVLFHGGAGSWMHWIRTIPDLSRTHIVWAPDLPGLGDSALPRRRVMPIDCARLMVAALRAAVPLEAGARPHLVGFSWGAHVATLAAGMLGGEIAGLTVIGCAALGLPHPGFDYARERSAMSEAERRAVHAANLALLMIKDPSRIDDLAIEIQARNVRRTRLRTRDFAVGDDIARALPDVAVPVHTIWGEHDQIGLPDVAARIARIRSIRPELTARIVPDAGHWVMYEQPAAFNAALRDVLSAG